MLRPRRKSLTLPFSMFNARSKAPASKILDIDSADKDNDHATVEYVENMYAFYKEVEVLVVRPFILICFMDTCCECFCFVSCCTMRASLRCICIHILTSTRR
ncbi:hypothetical protein Bca4012_064932 [Brassica carinata]